MRAVVDLNILLDVFLQRDNHREAASLLAAVETGQIEGFLCANSVDKLHYLLRKASTKEDARRLLHTTRRLLAVLPVDAAVVDSALHLDCDDLEDAIIQEAARLGGVDVIVTRDKDFASGNLTLLTARQAVALLR